MHKKILITALLTIIPLCGLWHIGQAAYIHSKAIVAQLLLETAWQQTLAGQSDVKPWPWADTWPIAKLKVPRLDLQRIVLAGANGSALAFGPGHVVDSAPLSASGNSLIAGHRDTHFAFLRQLQLGDSLEIQRQDGLLDRYQVSNITIADEYDSARLYRVNEKQLTLITCYPFTAMIPGGPLRYVVEARHLPDMSSAAL